MKPPEINEKAAWAKHFSLDQGLAARKSRAPILKEYRFAGVNLYKAGKTTRPLSVALHYRSIVAMVFSELSIGAIGMTKVTNIERRTQNPA
jgi:hypothetical protein